MADSRKARAIQLRLQGNSINEVASLVGAAKSTVSIWTRDTQLSSQQTEMLARRSHTREAIEKRRQARLNNENLKRAKVINKAFSDIDQISGRELWLIGTALYWAEGGKTQRMVRFSNGDPEMIRFMMRYFRESCRVPESLFRGHIHIHEHLDSSAAEAYWSSVSAISIDKFYKTYNKPNKSSKGTRNTLPYGVFDIYVADVTLFLKIQGWTKAIYKK